VDVALARSEERQQWQARQQEAVDRLATLTARERAVLERVVVWDGVQVPPGHFRDGVFYDGGWLPIVG
jgi:hypothetical protein